jgi:2-polyprenyl-3-methyl-5-hydroxy-6-metoxy-1,4-benzoquinol methylase
MTEGDWRQAVQLWRQHAGEMLATLPPRACPACGADRSRWLFESYDAHPFHECERCGCWFEPKMVDSALFERFFDRCPDARALADHMMRARDREELRDADMTRIGSYLDNLLTLVPQPVRQLAYLDTGCGVGHSLRAGLARGFTVQGVEVDRTAIALARADGLPVAALDEALPPGPYQLLSFWETLEHIAAPLEALERFVPYLADDGLVAITVPNLNALATRTLREACAWVHGGYNTPGHVNLFHRPALERLLARAGLTVIDADGQFSGNPVEITAYLAGATRGAFETLDPSLERRTVPASVEQFLSAVWPGPALVERLTLASPILELVACRQGQEARFASALMVRRAQRRRELEEQARMLVAGEPDYKAMTVALQQEVAYRDALLTTSATELQQEVTRRDRLLETTQQIANSLQHQLAEAQRQINLRDDLLVEARKKFAETVDERLRRALRALRGSPKS